MIIDDDLPEGEYMLIHDGPDSYLIECKPEDDGVCELFPTVPRPRDS